MQSSGSTKVLTVTIAVLLTALWFTITKNAAFSHYAHYAQSNEWMNQTLLDIGDADADTFRYQVRVPVILKLYHSGESTHTDQLLISRLVNRTQRLIDDELSRLNWRKGVSYEILMFHELDYLNYFNVSTSDDPNEVMSYEIQLLHSDQESFFISPFSKKVTYLYQTDFLISKNLMGVFIKNVIIRHLLWYEILDYVDPTSPFTADSTDEEDGLINLASVTSELNRKVEAPLELTSQCPTTLIITYRYFDSDVITDFDHSIFEELVRHDIVLFLQDYINLEIELKFEQMYSGSDLQDAEDGYKHLIDLITLENELNYDQLKMFVYVIGPHDEIHFTQDDRPNESISNNYVLTFLQKGGVQIFKLSESDTDEIEPILTTNLQIQILEIITGQVLKIIGLSPQCLYPEPKSPFIRLEFLIRRQTGINLRKLWNEGCCAGYGKEECQEIEKVVRDGRYHAALALSWDLLQKCF